MTVKKFIEREIRIFGSKMFTMNPEQLLWLKKGLVDCYSEGLREGLSWKDGEISKKYKEVKDGFKEIEV